MKVLGRFFDFYLDASIHVALAIVSLFWATSKVLNIPLDRHLFVFVLFSSMGCYNFIKYGVEAGKYSQSAKGYHNTIRFFGLVCLGIALSQVFFLEWETILVLVLLGILTGLYALPVLPGTRNFRSLGLFKVVTVGLVWTGTTVFLPLVSAGIPIHWDIAIEGFQRFIVVIILILPFEIRDMAYDAPELLTIPRLYGVHNTKTIGLVLNILFFLITFLKDEIGTYEIWWKGFLFLILGLVVWLTKHEQGKYFASFWVEAVPIIWCLFIWSFGKLTG